jgi:uncharacterized membrane protein
MSPDIEPSSTSPRASAPESDRIPMRTLLSGAACVAYPFLVYWVLGQRQPWFGPMLTLAALLALCACLPGRRARAVAVFSVLALVALSLVLATPSTLLYLPPICVNLGLAWLFGRTLAPGQQPLITRFARLEQAEPGPAVLAYTRRLTCVWVGFFLVMATLSVILATLGLREAWMWFTAVGNYLCVAALFAIEYAWRRRRFPRSEHVSPARQVALLRAALRDRR